MQGERVSAQALVQLMSACLGAGALDLGLQLCNAALFAQVRRPCGRAGVSAAWPRPPKHWHGKLNTCTNCCPPTQPPTHPRSTLQGSEAAPLFERLLEAAAEAGRFDAVVDTLSAMRAAELPVSSQAAALVGWRAMAGCCRRCWQRESSTGGNSSSRHSSQWQADPTEPPPLPPLPPPPSFSRR